MALGDGDDSVCTDLDPRRSLPSSTIEGGDDKYEVSVSFSGST
jgi:hypothetical protein